MDTPLKRARESLGITTYDVARAVGIAQSHYSRVENGQTGASPELAEKLTEFFKGSVSELEILYPQRRHAATSREDDGEAA